MIRDDTYLQVIDRVASAFVDWFGVDVPPQRSHPWMLLAKQDRLVNLFVQTSNADDRAAVVLRIAEIREGMEKAGRILSEIAKGWPPCL